MTLALWSSLGESGGKGLMERTMDFQLSIFVHVSPVVRPTSLFEVHEKITYTMPQTKGSRPWD